MMKLYIALAAAFFLAASGFPLSFTSYTSYKTSSHLMAKNNYKTTHGDGRRQMILQTAISTALLINSPILSANAAEMAKEIPTNQAATSAGRKGCRTDTNPSRTFVECRGELLGSNTERRLSGVSATANGVSTSAVRNPSRFSPPWTYLTETSDSNVAWRSLVDAVKSVGDKIEIVELTDDCECNKRRVYSLYVYKMDCLIYFNTAKQLITSHHILCTTDNMQSN